MCALHMGGLVCALEDTSAAVCTFVINVHTFTPKRALRNYLSASMYTHTVSVLSLWDMKCLK